MTKRRNDGKKSRFGTGLMIYAWVLLILGGIVLFLLQNVLTVFEASRPQHCVEAYSRALAETLPPAAADALAELDTSVHSPEENALWAQGLLKDARLVKDPTSAGEDLLVYRIRAADGQTLGQVVFGVTGETQYAFPIGQALGLSSLIISGSAESSLPVWSVVEEQFDFSAYYQTVGITVPADYQVYLGDRLLGPECVVEDGIPYAALEECYLHYEDLPTMVRYESGPFVGELALRVCDETGTELAPEELTEAAFLDRCAPEIQERADAFVPEFIPLYVLFSADIRNSFHYYYNQLTPMVVPGSQLAIRMRQAFEGFGYSGTRSAELLSTKINRVTDLGEGRYLVDVSYSTQIRGQGDTYVVDDHVLLVLIDFDGTLLADALYYS